MYIKVGSTIVGSVAATGYMRGNTPIHNHHQNSSLHINEVLELNDGDVITIFTIGMSDNHDTVTMVNAASNTPTNYGISSFYIEKIK